MTDTRQCPYCRQWITMPLRRQREAFDAHKRTHNNEITCARCGAAVVAGLFHTCDAMNNEAPRAAHYARPRRTLAEQQRARAEYRALMAESAAAPEPSPEPAFNPDCGLCGAESELNGFKATQGALL